MGDKYILSIPITQVTSCDSNVALALSITGGTVALRTLENESDF